MLITVPVELECLNRCTIRVDRKRKCSGEIDWLWRWENGVDGDAESADADALALDF